MSEREVQHEPQVIEGEDELPRQPADRDSYAPAAPPRRARAALWAALLVLLGVAAAILVWALVT